MPRTLVDRLPETAPETAAVELALADLFRSLPGWSAHNMPPKAAFRRADASGDFLPKTLLIRAATSPPSMAGLLSLSLSPRSIALDRDPLAAHLVDHRLGAGIAGLG